MIYKYILTNKPFLKVFISIALGIVAANEFGWWGLLGSTFIFGIIQYLFQVYFKIGYIRKEGIAALCIFMQLTGSLYLFDYQYKYTRAQRKLQPIFSAPTTYLVRIEQPPEVRPTSTKLEATLLSFLDSGKKAHLTNFPIIIYLDKKIDIDSIGLGNILAVYGQLNPPAPPLNPLEFDYQNYLRRKGVVATGYSNQIVAFGKDSSFWFGVGNFPLRLRSFFSDKIKQYVSAPREQAIALSLLLGERTAIEPDVYEAYTSTGTVHILSVSGVHFAIFFALVSWIVNLIIPERFALLRFGVKQPLSFLYALLTGFSPPVFRSFLMLFFLDLQTTTGSKKANFNVLFLSAVIILLFSPSQLFNIGFQLSYAALIGLMILYQKLEQLIKFRYFIPRKIWEITCGLVAAWTFTLPLTLFYFHRISFLGMIANFIVVPISSIILWIGYFLILFASTPFSWASNILGKALEYLLYFQNEVILRSDKIPLASIENVYFNEIDVFICFLLLAFFIYWGNFKLKSSLYVMLVLVIFWGGFRTFRSLKTANEQHWILFQLRKHTAFGYKQGQTLHLFTDSIPIGTYNNSIAPYICRYEIQQIQKYPLRAYFDQIEMKFGIGHHQNPEFMLLCRENKPIWKEFLKDSNIILMNSMGKFYREKYKNEIPNAQILSDTSRAIIIENNMEKCR